MKKTILLLCTAFLWQFAKAQHSIPSVIKGLTIMMEYKDFKFSETEQEISDLMNKPGYNVNGNLGSVRDFYYTQTNGKVTITSTVVKVSLPESYDYYHSPGQNYLESAIDWINANYPQGFQGLTVDPWYGKLMHLNILERTPHGGSTTGVDHPKFVKNNTTEHIEIGDANIITQYTGPISVGGICHEMGHSVMNWTDYYYTFFCNLGHFDVMASAGTDYGPMPINPGLRLQRGWIDNVVDITGTVTQNYILTANDYTTIHRYKNPNNPKEYLLFHALKISGYYQSPVEGMTMPEGLAIWYVDEERGFDSPLPVAYQEVEVFFIRLVQADNKDEMHIYNDPNVKGDAADLYGNANKSFPNGHPLRWKDGGELGISISNISSPGATMSFTVNARPNTLVASTDIFGTISPKGTLSVAGGQSKTFSLIPSPGYEVNIVKENGVTVTTTNPYTSPAFSGTKTVSVSFKRKSPVAALTAPWQQAAIGNVSSNDFVAQSGGTLYMETYGNSIGDVSDNFTFAYQAISGNGTFIAHIAYYSTLPEGRTGLMVRESLDAGSEYWSVFKYNYGGTMDQSRPSLGVGAIDNPTNATSLEAYNLYNWLKIEKNGDNIASFCSKDGVNWTMIGAVTLSISTKCYIGMFTKGYDAAFPSIATFDNISFSTLASPSVSIVSPANNAVLASRTFTINATAAPSTANGSITKIDFYNGTTLIGSDNTAPYSFTWTNAPGGLQSIVAKVTDNSSAIAITKVHVDVPCTYSDLKIGGTVIGTEGSYADAGNTRDKVFDGDATTFFDAPIDVAWAGLALSGNYKITGIKFFPRVGATYRMTGGKFQGSSTSDFSSDVTDLGIVAVEPRYGWNCFDVTIQTSFKYLRYVGPPGGVGNVAEVEFYGVSANVPPTVAITSPTSSSIIETAPVITITANASDVDGTIAKVEFYAGGNLIGTDNTAPYTCSWNNPVPATYVLTAVATDNLGAVTSYTITNVTVIFSTGPITGPACGSNNTTLTFELSASKKTNATGYNWWYTGSIQSITPVSGSPYKVTLTTGSNFGGGDVCVGVNYSVSPWYASYCKSITKCAAKMSSEDGDVDWVKQTSIYPNPSSDAFNLNLASDAETVVIINNLGVTVYKVSSLMQGDIVSIGENFEPGIYSVSIQYLDGRKEIMRMIKIK